MSEHVLIVEDDEKLAALMADFLRSHGYSVDTEGDGARAVTRVFESRPDAVVLDVMLPGLDGFEICRRVRPGYRGVVIIVTARDEEIDEVLGLELGADDYLMKPVRPRALLARLRGLLRGRVASSVAPALRAGRIEVDPSSREARLDDRRVDLTTAEFDLLWLLVERAGRVVERDDLHELLYGRRWDGVDRSVDLRVSRLRRKLGDTRKPPELLKSVRGTGYLLASS